MAKKATGHIERDLSEVVGEAEKATATLSDPDLRKIAFERVLSHLLEDNLASTTSPSVSSRRHGKTAKTGKRNTSTSSKPGPMTWLKELVDENYFSEPRPITQILEALAERGHNLAPNDISGQLTNLTKAKVLRRKKQPITEGGKGVYFYSTW